jgi:hypothetical protein
MTSKTTATKRQTQKGVARASAARNRTEQSAARVRNINTARKAAQQTVESTIIDVLQGKTTRRQAEKQVDAAVASVEAAKSTTPRKRIAAKKAAAKSESTTIKPQDETRSAVELRDTLRSAALESADTITAAAKRLQSAESTLKSKEIDARNPATDDSLKAHKDRDAAIKELI